MSVYTSVSSTQLEQFLLQYDCGDLIDFKGIREGISNSNYHLKTTNGNFILTLYEHVDETSLSTILALQNHLQKSGINCAAISNTRQHQLFNTLAGKPATIMEKLPGSIDYTVTDRLCEQTGIILAKFHLAAANFDFTLPNPRGSEWVFETVDKLITRLSTDDQQILVQELDFLRRYSRLSLPSGAIHADLFPDNVLVENNSITGIIDFDLSCHEVYLFDICIAINAWCSDVNGQLNRYHMRDLLSAYSTVRPLTADENIAIPMMLRATALRFWLSRLHDRIFPPAGTLILSKDPDEFKTILLARRQRLSGMQR